ncbi:hypothetical protein ACI797_08365 [Geodermatophilus sp. SYSU D00691]
MRRLDADGDEQAVGRADVVDRDALRAQADGDRLADPGASAVDQCLLVLQTLHVLLRSSSTRLRPCVKTTAVSAVSLIREAAAVAPNEVFQKARLLGGPSCGPTCRSGSCVAELPSEQPWSTASSTRPR